MGFDVLLNDSNEFWYVMKAAATDLFVCQLTKPALHHIKPRTGCWGEVEMEARMPAEPGLNARMLVRTVVVDDEMKLLSGRGFGVDLLEEANELLMPMAWHAVSYDFSVKHTECGE